MKSFIFRFSTIIFFFICANTTVFSQEIEGDEYYYLLEFESMEQQEVKPLIAALMPVFKEVPHLEQDEYSIFYYQAGEYIEMEQIQTVLNSTETVLLRFETISKSNYEQIID